MAAEKAMKRRRRSQSPAAEAADEHDFTIVTDSYGFLVRTAQVRAFQEFYREFGDTKLSPADYAALALIHRNPGIRPGLLANLLAIREPNMTPLVRELAEAGLVNRVPLRTDARATGLELTERGTGFFADVHRRGMAVDERLTARLSAAERAQLMRLLKKSLDLES